MLDLTVVVPYLNQPALTEQALKFLAENKTNPDTQIIAFDNDSDQSVQIPEGVAYFRSEENIGNYPVFNALMGLTRSSVIAVLHSDVFVYEKGYDDRILRTFEENQQLGLVGFVGSNEIDGSGGRGAGTMSNFMGNTTVEQKSWPDGVAAIVAKTWFGSPAEVHGRRETGFARAAVVDGCVMIFRRKALEEIGYRADFPLHHFYDRLMSCQMLEKNWQVGVLGVQFDHLSGQTANQEQRYHDIAKDWCEEHGIGLPTENSNWDTALYLEAERRFLREYRNEKGLIPIKV